MADLIKKGQEWEASKRRAWRSQTVTIMRGLDSTSSVPATIGNTSFTVETQTGLAYEDRARDFIIDRADYQFNGTPVEPQEDDLIIDASTGEAITYRVLPNLGEPEKRWSDPYGIAWRITTKRA